MKKKMKLLVTLSLVVVVLLGNVVSAFAAPKTLKDEQLSYITEGYTEDGIRYTIYEIITPINDGNGFTPFIVVSKLKTYKISFEGHITPPKTFIYEQYESDRKTTMKGTLNLQSYTHDIWPYFPKSTNATYKGYIFGHL